MAYTRKHVAMLPTDVVMAKYDGVNAREITCGIKEGNLP
jgi:hypothetical protein